MLQELNPCAVCRRSSGKFQIHGRLTPRVKLPAPPAPSQLNRDTSSYQQRMTRIENRSASTLTLGGRPPALKQFKCPFIRPERVARLNETWSSLQVALKGVESVVDVGPGVAIEVRRHLTKLYQHTDHPSIDCLRGYDR